MQLTHGLKQNAVDKTVWSAKRRENKAGVGAQMWPTKSLVSPASLQEYNLNIVENPAEMLIPEGWNTRQA